MNRKDAERLLAARLTDAERGRYQAPSKIAFDEFAEKYMRYAHTILSSKRDAVQIPAHDCYNLVTISPESVKY